MSVGQGILPPSTSACVAVQEAAAHARPHTDIQNAHPSTSMINHSPNMHTPAHSRPPATMHVLVQTPQLSREAGFVTHEATTSSTHKEATHAHEATIPVATARRCSSVASSSVANSSGCICSGTRHHSSSSRGSCSSDSCSSGSYHTPADVSTRTALHSHAQFTLTHTANPNPNPSNPNPITPTPTLTLALALVSANGMHKVHTAVISIHRAITRPLPMHHWVPVA